MTSDGTPGEWFQTTTSPYYDWRAALPNEVIFDTDDPDWTIAREKTILMTSALRDHQVEFLLALTGRKGTHAHVFLAPTETYGNVNRSAFAEMILDHLREEYGAELQFDPVGYAKERQMFREFGTRARHRKTMWTKAPHTLPDTREQAYAQAGVCIPASLPEMYSSPLDWRRTVKETLGIRCNPACKTICEECPALNR